MAEMHLQARASSPYELVPNILRYTLNRGSTDYLLLLQIFSGVV